MEHADDPGRPLVARGREPEPLDELLVARAAGHGRRARVRHVREQRAERDQQLDPEVAREADDELGERAPAQVRLDPEQQHDVAVEALRPRVVEGRLRPVDPAAQALLERDVRTGRLEVEEVLRDRRPRSAPRPRSWRGSRPPATPPARRRSSRERRRRGSAARAPAAGRCEARPPLGQSTCGLAARAAGGRHRTRDEGHQQRPDRGGEADVHEHERPGQVRPVLHLAERHLREQHARRRPAPSPNSRGQRCALRGEVAEHEDERDREDRDRRGMDVDQRLQPPEPVDVLRAAAGVRPAGRRERPGQEQHAGRRGQRERAAPQLERRDRLRAAGAQRQRLEREHDRAGQQGHREQQVRGHDRPVQVAVHGEVAERRLGERADEDRERQPPRAAATGRARRTTRPRSAARARSRRRRARGSRTR